MVVENTVLQSCLKSAKETGNWEKYLSQSENVINYAFKSKFPNIHFYHYDIDGLKQECLIQVWRLSEKGQVKDDGNIFSYIIGCVSFYLRDCIRKYNRRALKAKIISFEDSPLANVRI